MLGSTSKIVYEEFEWLSHMGSLEFWQNEYLLGQNSFDQISGRNLHNKPDPPPPPPPHTKVNCEGPDYSRAFKLGTRSELKACAQSDRGVKHRA